MKTIEAWLNGITMYRLVLYELIGLLVVGAAFSLFGWLPFSFISLIFSALFLVCASVLTNDIFAKFYGVATNVESAYISALILALIIPPAKTPQDLIFLTWAAVLTNAGKYILNLKKVHLFNPVAIAVVLTAWGFGGSATWWAGTAVMLPFTLIGGWLIAKKIRREDLVLCFLAAALIFTPWGRWGRALTESPLIFFATVMLTEPLTTPPTKNLRMIYGLIVGAIFYRYTPELALIAGNVFAYLVGYKDRLVLTLKEKIALAPGIYDFIFEPIQGFNFIPGQYLEWTLSHEKSDSRGNRRYFTLASAPTETHPRLGVRFNQPSSSFKTALLALRPGQTITAGGRAGDFTLPKNPHQKLAFVAGGIGITPFRSMVKYLTDSGQKRDIVLFYSNKTEAEIVYRDIWDSAALSLGLKTKYLVTSRDGHLDAAMVAGKIPDWKERLFYVSGPQRLVNSLKSVLTQLGLPRRQIKTDFFPGF